MPAKPAALTLLERFARLPYYKRRIPSWAPYLTLGELEDYEEYVRSPRCGVLCNNSEALDLTHKVLPGSSIPSLFMSPCRSFRGLKLGRQKLLSRRADAMVCPPGGVIRFFVLTYDSTPATGSKRRARCGHAARTHAHATRAL